MILRTLLLAFSAAALHAADTPRLHEFKARASELDPRAKAHPEIGFLIEDKQGKPADIQHASVDTRVEPRGELVIWLMGHNGDLAKQVNSFGLHYIQPHYARHWFGTCCQENPVGENCRGDIRLEAAIGEDISDEVDIPYPDSMAGRSLAYVKWLAKKHPEGKWDQFLAPGGRDLLWEKVIVSGISHGATTAARFAKHTKVARVVCFTGPRDQFQVWQSLPSATPENRYFGFSHVIDAGWIGDHYCRSWQLLGLAEFGPIVNVEESPPPYGNTRRLVTNFDVGGDGDRAHNTVIPQKGSSKTADGGYAHEPVWRYLFTSPVEETGEPVPADPDCRLDHRTAGN